MPPSTHYHHRKELASLNEEERPEAIGPQLPGHMHGGGGGSGGEG
jgi:hypothetical protein